MRINEVFICLGNVHDNKLVFQYLKCSKETIYCFKLSHGELTFRTLLPFAVCHTYCQRKKKDRLRIE